MNGMPKPSLFLIWWLLVDFFLIIHLPPELLPVLELLEWGRDAYT